MKSVWLNKNNNKNLIVFYSGWGVSENSFKHLAFGKFDICFISDYSEFLYPKIDFDNYDKKILLAWSFGVLAGACDTKKYDKRIAINGTNFPYSNDFGISERIYDLMIDKISPSSITKFKEKLNDDKIIMKSDITGLKDELKLVKNFTNKGFLPYDFAIISKNDKIISSKNQIKFWEKKGVKFLILQMGHSIFGNFNSWEEVLNVE